GDIANGRTLRQATPHEKLVERAQRAEAKLRGRAAELVPPQMAQIRAEVVALQAAPGRRLMAFLLMPTVKLVQRLRVVANGVSRSSALGSEMLDKAIDP